MVKHPRNCVLRKVLISYTRHGLAKLILWASVRDASCQPYQSQIPLTSSDLLSDADLAAEQRPASAVETS